MKLIEIVLIFFIALNFNLETKPQNLPEIQINSIRIPSNFKIDGIASEWNNQFAAYNKSLRIYYSIANDAGKIYLILKTDELQTINKIVQQGITFNIKSVNDDISISYPVYDKEKRPLFLPTKERKKGENSQEELINDSLKHSFNSKLIENLLKIGVNGISTIKDSLISIYNPEGIRANGRFDVQLNYTLELLLPLKLAENTKFKYTIQLNGVPGRVEVITTSIGDRITYNRHGESWMLGRATPQNYAFAYPSILSGTYTLFK